MDELPAVCATLALRRVLQLPEMPAFAAHADFPEHARSSMSSGAVCHSYYDADSRHQNFGQGGLLEGTAAHPYLPRQMLHQFATALENLGTSYVGLYHLHSSDFGPRDVRLGPVVTTMRPLRDQASTA